MNTPTTAAPRTSATAQSVHYGDHLIARRDVDGLRPYFVHRLGDDGLWANVSHGYFNLDDARAASDRIATEASR